MNAFSLKRCSIIIRSITHSICLCILVSVLCMHTEVFAQGGILDVEGGDAQDDGISIYNIEDDAIQVSDAGQVLSASLTDRGIWLHDIIDFGISMGDIGGDGLRVTNAGE